MTTVAALLSEARRRLRGHSDSADIDAEVLLCHLLDKPRSFLFTWPEHDLSDARSQQFLDWVGQRAEGRPVAYLVGRREFFGHDFLVCEDTLIPRADTELLVEAVLESLPPDSPQRVADLGTGSGAIAISLALARPLWQLDAVDFTVAILDLVQRNVTRLGASNVRLLQSNWCARLDGEYDAIVSNPPYIAEHDRHLDQGDVRFEPRTALVSGEDGLDDIRMIIEQARAHLKRGGLLAFEHGYDQGQAVRALLTRAGFANVETRVDLGGNDRVTLGHAD